jgi:hypothetical protein
VSAQQRASASVDVETPRLSPLPCGEGEDPALKQMPQDVNMTVAYESWCNEHHEIQHLVVQSLSRSRISLLSCIIAD